MHKNTRFLEALALSVMSKIPSSFFRQPRRLSTEGERLCEISLRRVRTILFRNGRVVETQLGSNFVRQRGPELLVVNPLHLRKSGSAVRNPDF